MESNKISADDWFEVLKMPRTLSPTEKMWLKTGSESKKQYSQRSWDVTVDNLNKFFSINFGISYEELRSRSRKGEIAEARQMCMHYLRTYHFAPYSKIGEAYGRDHSTAIHSENTINSILETDPLFRMKYCKMLEWVGMARESEQIQKMYKGGMIPTQHKRKIRHIPSGLIFKNAKEAASMFKTTSTRITSYVTNKVLNTEWEYV